MPLHLPSTLSGLVFFPILFGQIDVPGLALLGATIQQDNELRYSTISLQTKVDSISRSIADLPLADTATNQFNVSHQASTDSIDCGRNFRRRSRVQIVESLAVGRVATIVEKLQKFNGHRG